MTPATTDLPIEDVLPRVRATLRDGARLVVAAPPGAGKTTRLPLALLEDEWTQTGRLVMLEPRRIAARAAAERMAATRGERVGQSIGLRSRLDVRTSRDARIEVVTEGVFTRMLLSDPTLDGVSGVLFDEFHERSLDADVALALSLDVQSMLRPDLRIVVMSATLDTARVASRLECPAIESAGRAYPVETVYLGRDPRARIEDLAADAIHRAIGRGEGSVLAFLPGAAEIRRTAERLDRLPADVAVTPLYGALSPAEQDAAIRPAPPGRRKVVLATDIAESSLTIDGVTIVVDAGLARVPRHDPATGVSRLETARASLASADQRRGRAGRTAPGVCYRLWHEAENRGLAASVVPEILTADLSQTVLDLAGWGARTPDALPFLDPPPQTAWDIARRALEDIGALDADGGVTAFGRRLADLPLPPRLGRLVMTAADRGDALLGAEIAALLSERELGGRSTDISDRLRRFADESGGRAKSMRDLAERWARMAAGGKPPPAARDRFARAGDVLAAAFPDRVARLRGGAAGRFVLAGGRGGMLDETDPLARETWIVAADLTGGGADLRITLAARLDEAAVVASGAITTVEDARYDPDADAVRARRVRRAGAIILDETPLPRPTPDVAAKALLEAVRTRGLAALPCASRLDQLCARIAFLSAHVGPPWPADLAETLAARIDDWLAPLLTGCNGLRDLDQAACERAAAGLVEGAALRDLDRLAPVAWTTPAGRAVPIDYTSDGGPRAECKVQEAYGTASHPMLAGGRAPLILALLSPAMRPVAMTRDLPGFWRGGYADMRKDMRGRYPKHDWPDDPAAATPTSRARPRRPD